MLELILQLFISFCFFIIHGISFCVRSQAIRIFNNMKVYFLFDPVLTFLIQFIHLYG